MKTLPFIVLSLLFTSCVSGTLVLYNSSDSDIIVSGKYSYRANKLVEYGKTPQEYATYGEGWEILYQTDSTLEIKIHSNGYTPIAAFKGALSSKHIEKPSEASISFLNPLLIIGKDTLKFEGEEFLLTDKMKNHPRLKSKDYRKVGWRKNMIVYLEYNDGL